MKFIILVDPSLVLITAYLHCYTVIVSLGVEKIFKEIHTLYTFYPKIITRWDGGGGMKFTISCLLTQQMLHNQIVLSIYPADVTR